MLASGGSRGGGGDISAAPSDPAIPNKLIDLLKANAKFHDPIYPKYIIETPVRIPIDEKNCYDEKSLNAWREDCIRNNHTKVEGGKTLMMLPSDFEKYYDPSSVKEDAEMKKELEKYSKDLREYYRARFPDTSEEEDLLATSEVLEKVMASGFEGNDNFRGISSDIFKELDRISKLDVFAKLKLKPPQIVALGAEKHGKSSLLERLVGFPIFPTRTSAESLDGACTTCPLRVILRRSKEKKIAIVKIRSKKSGGFVNPLDRNNTTIKEISVPIICLPSVLKKTMEDMRANSTKLRIGDLETNRPSLNKDVEIIVEIQTPLSPNLDILDLPGLTPADISAENLAKSILETEKDHSMVLLVVQTDASGSSNIGSAATPYELISKSNLTKETTGVYTFIDTLDDDREYEHITACWKLTRLFDATANDHIRIPWMGCSNLKPMYSRNMHDNIRLFSTDLEEAKTIQDKKFTNFMASEISGFKGKDLLGVPAIRSRLETVYEKYICKNWACNIWKHLIKHFYKLSDSNLRLGLPMLKNQEYSKTLEKIMKVLKEKSLFPDYDFHSMFHLCDEEAITKLVFERAKVVCTNLEWMKLHECKGTFYATFEELKKTVLPPNEIDVGVYFDESDKIEGKVLGLLGKVRDQILAFADTVSESFVTAALGNRKVSVGLESGWRQDELHEKMTNVKRFKLSTFPSDWHTSILQLALIPGLLESYRKFISQRIEEVNDEFRIHVATTLSNLKGNLIYAHDLSLTTDGIPKVMLKYVNQIGPQAIGNEFFIFWLHSFRSKLSSFTNDWVVPTDCFDQYLGTSTYSVRKGLLEEMLDVTEALKSIKDLQRKYSEVNDFTEQHWRLPEIEAEEKKKQAEKAEKDRLAAEKVKNEKIAKEKAEREKLAKIAAQKKQLQFSSIGDKNGVLHFIGTRGGTAAYANPQISNSVVVSCSSTSNGAVGCIVGRENLDLQTSSAPGQWVKVDLGRGRLLVPDFYSFKHGRSDTLWFVRNWRFEGSIDDINWITLREHANDATINAAYAPGSWSISNLGQSAYRYFRVYNTGVDSNTCNFLSLCCLELYGKYSWETTAY